MKAIAPVRGMSGYQTLLKSYISEDLRRDEAEYLSADATARLAEALKARGVDPKVVEQAVRDVRRSEEQTAELQSLMRISYAVSWLKKKNNQTKRQMTIT